MFSDLLNNDQMRRRTARVLLFVGVLVLAVLGQLAAKAGALQASAGNIINVLLAASLLCLFARALLWTMLLRRERLIFAYPLMSLTYPLMLLFAHIVFEEPVTMGKVAGSFVVIAGVVTLSISESRL